MYLNLKFPGNNVVCCIEKWNALTNSFANAYRSDTIYHTHAQTQQKFVDVLISLNCKGDDVMKTGNIFVNVRKCPNGLYANVSLTSVRKNINFRAVFIIFDR